MTLVLRKTFTQNDLDRFGAASGGDGRIHTDPAFAAGTVFGHTLVQGMLLVALMERAVAISSPERRNGARLEITFVAPVGPGTEIRVQRIDDPVGHHEPGRQRFEATAGGAVVLAATLDRVGQP